MKKSLLFILLFFSLCMSFELKAQTVIPGDSLVFGPMFSPVYENKVRVWVLTKGNTGSGDALSLTMTGSQAQATELSGSVFNSDDRLGYYLRSYEFNNLTEGETYTASLQINGNVSSRTSSITNDQNVIDNFEFLAGGCGRIYDTSRCVDTPESLTHINGNPELFNHMAAEDADLMVWLGDATYLLGLQHANGECPDAIDDWANKDMAFDRYMFYRQFHDQLTMAMPQLAITDNHDTGPNEFDKTMATLPEMRDIFKDWWPNPEYLDTVEGEGMHSSYVYKDVEFFLTDNRSYRDGTADHFGDEQLEWLKQGLLNSKATFKVIINGTPTFREVGGRNFSVSNQADEFLQFIQNNNINGVVSYCADIHDQRFMVRESDTKYPMYDIMSGNINSDIGGNGEVGNYNVNYSASNDILTGVKHGYVRTNVYGEEGDRRIKFEYVGFDGTTFFEEVVHQDMLTSQNSDAHNLSLDFTNAVVDNSDYSHILEASNYSLGADKDDNVNSALVFSKNTTLTIPVSTALNFYDKAYSLSFWINPSSLPSNGSTIVSDATATTGVSFGISKNGNLNYKDHATGVTHESNYSVLENDWSYITWKYDNVRKKLTLYYNGFLIQTWNNVSSPTASTSDFRIGNNIEGKQFLGSIDNLELYARLISDNDILENAQVESNRGDMLTLSGAQQTAIPSDISNALFSDNFTVQFWAKLNADPASNASIFSTHGRVNNNSTGLSFEFSSENKLNVVVGTNGSGWNKIDNKGDAWTIGEWNHITISAEVGGSIKYYLNGEYVTEMAYNGYSPNTFGLGLGYSPNYGSAIQGDIDDMRIWSKVLSADEISRSLHYSLAGDETDLALYYNFAPTSETATTITSSGSINYEMDITSAALTSATSPLGNIPMTYRDFVSGKWSKNNSSLNHGLSFSNDIALFTSNIIAGKINDTDISETPNMSGVQYLQGGWKIDPLNTPFATFKFNLEATVGAAASSISAAAGHYYLLNKNEGETDFSMVDEGTFDGTSISFYNVNIEESVYYLAWEEGEFVPGRGGALALVNDHDVKIPYTSTENILEGAHTLELWLNLPDDPSDKTILSNHGRIDGNSTGFTLELESNNTLSVVYGTNGDGWTKVISTTALQIGEWNHVAISTTPESEVQLYINGQLEGSTAFSAYAPNSTWDFAFGRSLNYGGQVLFVVDEFRFWSEARTQEEIVSGMHSVLDITDENLQFYYAFDQEDNGLLGNNGIQVDDVNYTNASIIAASTPVAESVVGFDDIISGSWSYSAENSSGMYVEGTISSFIENIVFGRDNNKTILDLPNAEEEEEDMYYIAGGWNVNTMNITTTDITIELSSIFENVGMTAATVGEYILIKGDPQVAYEVVASATTATDNVVTFNDVEIGNGIYFIAYLEDNTAAILAQGGAFNLEGGHQVQIPSNTIESILAGDFTIELWAKLTSDPGENVPLLSNHGRVDGNSTGFSLEFPNNNSVNAVFGNNGSGWNKAESRDALTIGEWNHIAVTVSLIDHELKLYVNGELKATNAFDGYASNSTWDFALGRTINYNGQSNSIMDELRIWTKAKTQEEIIADMHQTLLDTDGDLAFNYTFNQDDSGYLVNSGNTVLEVAYTNADIVPATSPVRIIEAPFNNQVVGSWSLKNDNSNGMYYAEDIADFNSNIIFSKEPGDEVLPTADASETNVLYLNSRWKIDPLFINSGSVMVDVSKIFENLNQVELIANEYYLLSGEPSTAVEIAASGLKENNIISFTNLDFNEEEPLYLAWKNINEYPTGSFPIVSGGLWKYNDLGQDLGTDWKESAFDDSSWLFGNAILGYGDGKESTTLNFGTDASTKYPTYYFRHIFNVEDVAAIGNLLFNVIYDDGVIVYVNGSEAFRLNMPEGEVTYDMYAVEEVSGDAESVWTTIKTANLLQNGENVIAVELHQNNGTSSDVQFDMEVNYELPPLEVTKYPILKDEQWYVLDQGTDMGTDWLALDYNVIPWNRGFAPFGYGDPVNTEVSYGSDSNNKYITTYYIKDIEVSLSELTDMVELGLRRDDGAIIYINGVEALRSNMPTGTIDYQTPAINAVDGINENIYFTSTVAKGMFVEGINRIAVEIHQANVSSSDTRFDLYIQNTQDLAIDCEGEHIGCLTSITPTSQTSNLILSPEYDFQVVMKEGESYSLGGGNMPGTNDFTAYVAIEGSSEEGYLSVNHENTPGGVSILDIRLNTTTQLWEVEESQAVDLYSTDLVTTTRNCSGGITPWGTVVTAEESTNSGDVNGDGYQDVGWFVEIDPVTATVLDYDNDGKKDKLWAMGRMNHENVVISDDGTTAYYGEDGGTHCLYKYVMDTPGDLTEGTVYVLKMDIALSGNDPSSSKGTWIEVPNDSQSDRNNLNVIASSLGGTAFNGVEDVEINPITGKIYFAAKGLSRVYRFRDNEETVSDFETFVGGMNYDISSETGTQSEAWANGNDNLTFDDKGNLWVLQDGGKNYIWIVRPDHTQSNPNVELFASMPSGAEPTGLTFTPDYKYGFFSVQHPSGSNTSQVDASGNEVTFNASTTIVFALDDNIGEKTLGIIDQQLIKGVRLYPNPTDGNITLQFSGSIKNKEVSVVVNDILGRNLVNYNNLKLDGNQNLSLDLGEFKGQNQILLLTVEVNDEKQQFKVLMN
ncbi:LamG-like jellyroll fold domain-containing protein [Tamlana sp. 2_MG-2023]|uniref:LamG-like jellyroll fold domain-containing protein n=1 Tax=unclassified Tamlana TaxID=2614803 RepID=UPI0026E343B1|nr:MULTISPECIES: LamG-like jellyroll fold domain-containing protein [unclassified Tamlana]MDO6761678.1 LamG-like jellyroll fold domain-containing protein [Tamlana sp. 2_MG-2023]MDO6792232.1 LamG-like jellyroll fold domain-containing protein [Tamlana sp. 1_MG-2023]